MQHRRVQRIGYQTSPIGRENRGAGNAAMCVVGTQVSEVGRRSVRPEQRRRHQGRLRGGDIAVIQSRDVTSVQLAASAVIYRAPYPRRQ